ncbi:MAG: hypothetical protein GXY83_31650 [Rhodopirellula sp.]|nr:hypothetical protein [Rhodopirellula sp.]
MRSFLAAALLGLALPPLSAADESSAAPRYVRIGHYQCLCEQGDFAANLGTVLEGLQLAADARLDILSFPESFRTGYYAAEDDARAHAFALFHFQLRLGFGDTPEAADAARGLTDAVEDLKQTVPEHQRHRPPRKRDESLPAHVRRYEVTAKVTEAETICPKRILCSNGGYA